MKKLLTYVSLLCLVSTGCSTTIQRPDGDEILQTLFDEGVYYDMIDACVAGSADSCYAMTVARKALMFCLENYDDPQHRIDCTVDLYNDVMSNPIIVL